MDLPDAPADRARRAGQLPDLRHGARADDADGRRGRKPRTARHDAAVLGRRRACRCRCWPWRWASISPCARCADRRRVLRVWLQLVLATPVVLWGGWPFFQRGWASVVNRRLNMFTLIALGTGVAYVYSLVAALAPGIFPASFRGPMARCRSISRRRRSSSRWCCSARCSNCARARQTSSAIRALLDLAPKTARVLRDDGGEDGHPARRR